MDKSDQKTYGLSSSDRMVNLVKKYLVVNSRLKLVSHCD